MNKRILKKLSTKAREDLMKYWGYTDTGFFRAGEEDHCGLHSKYFPRREREALLRGDGYYDWIHPKPGTWMWGATSGGEEPEWHEQTAYELLVEILCWNCGDGEACSVEEYQRMCRYTGVKPQSPEDFARSIQETFGYSAHPHEGVTTAHNVNNESVK